MAYATAQSTQTSAPIKIPEAEIRQPRVFSIDDTIAMVKEMSIGTNVNGDRFFQINFNGLEFPPRESEPNYSARRAHYVSLLRDSAGNQVYRDGTIITPIYSIIHRESHDGYLLMGCLVHIPGTDNFRATYYMDGGRFGALNGNPDAVSEFLGPYENSPGIRLLDGEDPAKSMEFTKMGKVVPIAAEPQYAYLREWVHKLFRRTTGREMPRIRKAPGRRKRTAESPELLKSNF